MSKALLLSSFCTLAVVFSGSVFAAEGPGIPKSAPDGPGAPASVSDPIGDPEKQAETEAMLKGGTGKAITGELEGGPTPSSVQQPTPDPEEQEKTEERIKAGSKAIQDM
jgi:hypothetical protein